MQLEPYQMLKKDIFFPETCIVHVVQRVNCGDVAETKSLLRAKPNQCPY